MASVTQFVRFERRSSTSVPILDIQVLEKILLKCKNKKVAFISSCGSAKQGKTFTLNFILRSILIQSQGEDDLLDWENPEQPLQGFPWANGEDRVTEGMWITNEPTILKNSKDEDVAVFLVDTQGIFDEYSTPEESRIILSISLILSTTTVFSMKAELHEDKIAGIASVLNILQNQFPNQKLGGLSMLIKDWTVQQDYTHGEQGGSKYLARRLTISPNYSEESKHSRIIIRDHLRELHVFLFPHPGDKAMKDSFTGSLNEILPRFTKVLEAFLLSPKLLELDSACETGSNVLNNLESMISELYPSASIRKDPEGLSAPQARQRTNVPGTAKPSLSGLTSSLHPKQMVESLVEEYTSKLKETISENDGFMSNAALAQIHKDLYESAIANFQPESNDYGFKELKLHEKNLDSLIRERFEKARAQMEANRQSIEAELEATSADLLSDYEKQITEIPCTWTGDQVRKNTSLKVKKLTDEAIAQFLSKSESYKKDLVEVKEQRLKNLLKQAFDKHVQTQKRKEQEKEEAEFEFKKIEWLNEYREKIGKLLPASDTPLDVHDRYCNFVATTIDFQNPVYLEKLKEAFQQEYQKMIRDIEKCKETASKNNQSNSEVDVPMDATTSIDSTNHTDKSLCSTPPGQTSHLTTQPRELEDTTLIEAYGLYENRVAAFIQGFKFFVQDHRNKDEFEASCSTAREEAIGYIEGKLSTEDGRKRTITQFKEQANREYSDLESKFQENYNQCKGQVRLLEEEIRIEYRARITCAQEIAKTEDELRAEYSAICKDLTQKFGENGLNHRISMQESAESLRTEIKTNFEDVVLKKFQLEQRKESLETQQLRNDVAELYREAMNKHFESNPFTKPSDFLAYHTLLEVRAMRKFGGKQQGSAKLISDTLKSLYAKYSEKNDMNTPGEPAIGIDLGTTYCCVAIYQHGKVEIIKNHLNKNTIPSFVALLPEGEKIGEDAKLQAHENPQATVFDAKRLIGRKFLDEEVQKDVKLWPFKVVDDDDIPKIEVNNRKYTPEVISAKILKHIKTVAETHLKGTEVKNAVITVPAYFNDGQRQATRDAAVIAGLNVLQIINEPTAAAIAYHLHRNESTKQNVLVYDLGGGTFDVSVLTMTGGKIEVKAVGGDTHLGGEDFDQALVNFCVQKFQKQHGINLALGKGSLNLIEDIQASRILRRLRNECENRKKDLSSAPSTTITVTSIIRNLDLKIPITKGDFEQMNSVKFSETIRVVQRALLDAKLKKEDIDEVVLVGGSTRIPKIQELLQAFFSGKALCKSVNVDEAVAYGAAIQAAILNGCKEQKLQGMSLHDVAPMSIGIQVFGGSLSVIIPRNTSVPTEVTKKDYTTVYDYQTELDINIFEGEDPVAKKNHPLGSFTLKKIPRSRKGVENIHVTMKVNAEGILKVSAVCASNRASGDIVIEENKGRLTSTQIEEERRFLQEK